MAKGWHKEPRRHALASKGIKTADHKAQSLGKAIQRRQVSEAEARKPSKDNRNLYGGQYRFSKELADEINSDPVGRVLNFGGSLYEAGDKVTVSTEEPLYDKKGNRIDGKKGIILRRVGSEIEIVFNDKTSDVVPVGFLKAPEGFNKLSSAQMSKAISNDRKKNAEQEKLRKKQTLFSSTDLANIARRTNNNYHSENYSMIAKKIKSPLEEDFKNIEDEIKRVGYLTPSQSEKQRYLYYKLMGELKRKAPLDYKNVYERL